MKKRLLVIGSVGVRLRLKCPRLPYAGEKTDGTKYSYSPDCLAAAAALAAARMGVESVLLARVGNDGNGSKLASLLSSKGVDTRFMVKDKNAPTTLTVLIDEDEADVRLIRYKGASENLIPADVEEAYNCYPDAVLLRLEGDTEACMSAEAFANAKGIDLYVSAGDVVNAESIYLPKKMKAFIADARTVLAITGISPTNPDSSLRASLEICRKSSVEYIVFRMTNGCIYVYDGKYGRILDQASKGVSFCDVFAPALISEFMKFRNILSSARFAVAASSLWEACGETLDSVPTVSEVRHDSHL